MLSAGLTFSVAAALIVLLPGPDTLVVLRTLLRDGRRQAVFVVCGVLTGLLAWVGAAALGLSALLRASSDGYTALRIAGAIYLLWLGVQSLRHGSGPLDLGTHTSAQGRAEAKASPRGRLGGAKASPRGRRGLLGRGYFAGLATDLLNPKVGVFFVTFLPAFIPQHASVGLSSMLFGLIFIVETAGYFAVMLTVADRISGWMANPRIRRRLDRATGLVLVGFGIRLALEP